MITGSAWSKYRAGRSARPKSDPAAKIGPQAKTTAGVAGIVPNQPTAPATVLISLDKNLLPSTVTNEPDDRGNKSEFQSRRTEDTETGPTGNTGPTGTQPRPGASGAAATSSTGSTGTALGKPIPIQPKFANFPVELKLLPNWVPWRYLPPKSKKGGKWRKVPFQLNGKKADSTDRATWSGFDACCAAYGKGGFDGLGFVFDGEVGADGLCYCGVDFDACVQDGKVQSLARNRIKHLNTYTELSVSGTGFHCIARATPLDRIVKFDGVEVYTKARYFAFTGVAFGEIKAAPAEIRSLVDEVRAKEAAVKQQKSGRSGFVGMSSTELPNAFKNAKPAQAFAALDPQDDNLAEGIRTTPWFETLSPELKDEVVDYALGFIAKNTQLLELEADGGNNAEYYKLTTSVARSGAPNAEDIFVKHVSGAKNADPDEALRQHFSRCRASQPSGSREITVGTLLLLAQKNGADFDQWKRQAQPPPATATATTSGPVTWSPTELKVPFSKIGHRHWLYSTYLIRGELTVEGAPGGAGKTAHATGMAVEIATGKEVLGEKIYGADLKVLYINSEDSGVEMWRRIWAFCWAHNIKEQDLDRLYVAGTNDPRVQRLSFLRTEKNLSVLDLSAFQILASALEALRPDVLILDPLVAFCGGGDMNGNGVMALLVRELKCLAAKFNCAMLIIHHNRKGGEPGSAEAISGAAAIVNLARKALMPVPMTDEEAKKLGVLPSERFRYIKMIDAKSNFAPRSADSPWYKLHSVELPNPEAPLYAFGDNVQAITRVNLALLNNAATTGDDLKIRHAILDLVERGKMIDGQAYPYSPSPAGAKNERPLLDDAIAAVASATAPQQWEPADLKAVTQRAIAKMKEDGFLVEEQIPSTGRFRRGRALRVERSRIPDVGSDERAPLGDPAALGEEDLPDAANEEGGQLVNSRSID
jgi:hypothetical protein